MNKSLIKSLKGLGEALENTKDVVLPSSYWEKEEEEAEKRRKEREEFTKSLEMTNEKWIQKFTL